MVKNIPKFRLALVKNLHFKFLPKQHLKAVATKFIDEKVCLYLLIKSTNLNTYEK